MGEITSKTTEALRYLAIGILGFGAGVGFGNLLQPYSPISLVYAKDLNKDSRPDIVIQYESGEKDFFLQQPDGTFIKTDNLEEKLR